MAKYSLDQISKLLNIPKSTLRYWEEQGLIHSQRNENNAYREYTLEDLIIICDIIFYRSLNIPVKKLKHIYDVPLYDNYQYLQYSNQQLQSEIDRLTTIQTNLRQRMQHYETLMQALNGHFMFEEPFFDYIVLIDPSSGKNFSNYLTDQSILALHCKPYENPMTTYGIISQEMTSNDIIWQKNNKYSYQPCLVEITERVVNWELLKPQIKKLESQNKKIISIVMSFLIPDRTSDYYLAWIEYE